MKQRKKFSLKVLLVLWAALVNGCSLSSRVSSTPRSSTEQRLLVTSLKRAVKQFDLGRFDGKRVSLDLAGLTADKDFAKSFVTSELQSAGASIVPDEKEAEVRFRVIASAIGVDQDETLLGIPAFAAPVVGVPVPEVALFKWVKNRGYTELEAYAFDGETGRFESRTPPRIGKAKYDLFTILVLVSFGYTDLDKEINKANSVKNPGSENASE